MKLRKISSTIISILILLTLVGCGNKTSANSIEKVGEEPKQEFYRSIQVNTVAGDVKVIHVDGSELQAYEGMSLVDGDTVEVGEEANLLLKVDSDKNLLAEANTKFTLDAKGTEDSNQTQILLQSGSVLCEIQEKLKDDESFEVVTGSSTMSVRGTVFRSQVLEANTGTKYDVVEVFEGKVWSKLDTSESDYDVEVEPGSFVVAKQQADGDSSGYIASNLITDDFFENPVDLETTDDLSSITTEINYDNIKLSGLEINKLIEISNNGRKLSVEVTKLEEIDGKIVETKNVSSSSNGEEINVEIKTEYNEDGSKKINIGVIEYNNNDDNEDTTDNESTGPTPSLGDGGVDHDPKEGIEVSDEPYTPGDPNDPNVIRIPGSSSSSSSDDTSGEDQSLTEE